jgi:hypothetical protein
MGIWMATVRLVIDYMDESLEIKGPAYFQVLMRLKKEPDPNKNGDLVLFICFRAEFIGRIS